MHIVAFTYLFYLDDFFLNDIIEAVDEENKCIVADVSSIYLIIYSFQD